MNSSLKNRRFYMENMFYNAPDILFEFAKNMRNNPTEAECFLWNYISKNQIQGVRFKRQHPVLYFIADFYCHKAKLIVEIDGDYHLEPGQYQYDVSRDMELELLGVKVLRFSNKQVLFEIENVLQLINEEIKKRL